MLAQGTVFNNGTFESLTDPEDRTNDSTVLQLQGTFFSNNQFLSLTSTETPVAVLNQGTIELPIWNPTNNQGATVEEETPLDGNNIAILQGMVVENSQIKGSVIENSELETLSLENSPIPSLDILSYETDRMLADRKSVV